MSLVFLSKLAIGGSIETLCRFVRRVIKCQSLSRFVSEGATFALPEAAGAASAANRFREREAAEAEGPRGEPGGKAQEDSGNERPGGLQQGHQW